MAVDITELEDALKREVNPPNIDLLSEFTVYSPDYAVGHLRDSFWQCVLFDIITGYRLNDDEIVPIDENDDDLGEDRQQIIVLYAAVRILMNRLANLKTAFKAQAGPVAFQTAQDGNLLRDILKAKREMLGVILTELGGRGGSRRTAVFDAVIERTYTIAYNDTWWIR